MYVYIPISIIVFQILIDAGSYTRDGSNLCYRRTEAWRLFDFVTIFFGMVLAAWMTSILIRTYDGLENILESVPDMKRHIFVNRWFSPALWMSTTLMYVVVTKFQLVSKSPIIASSIFVLGALMDSTIMFYTVFGPPFVFSTRVSTHIDIEYVEKTLRSEVVPLLFKFMLDDEWVYILPLIIDFTFYPTNERLWIEFPHIPPCCIASDIADRKPYLLEYLIFDKRYTTALETNSRYRNEAPTIHNLDHVMDVIEGKQPSDDEASRIHIYLTNPSNLYANSKQQPASQRRNLKSLCDQGTLERGARPEEEL